MKAGKYSGRVYRYAMAPAINIAGKVDGESGVGGTMAEALRLAFTMKRRKDTPSSSGVVFLPLVSSSLSSLVPRRRFLFPRDARRLTRLSSKFTLYRRSTKPRPLQGFIKN